MKSVFEDMRSQMYRIYDVELFFPQGQRIAGSIPDNPVDLYEMAVTKVMRAHGLTREQIEREDVRYQAEIMKTARFYMEETNQDPALLDKREEIAELAKGKMVPTNILRRDATGLWFPSHSFKAALKENTNILFAGEKWGNTNKGGISYVAERVFVDPSRLYMYRDGEILKNADGVQMRHGTVPNVRTGGMTSIVTQHEYVEGPFTMRFELHVLDIKIDVPGVPDGVSPAEELRDRWPLIMLSMERNGLGSQRKQSGYGCFKVARFEQRVATGGFQVSKAKRAASSTPKKVTRLKGDTENVA